MSGTPRAIGKFDGHRDKMWAIASVLTLCDRQSYYTNYNFVLYNNTGLGNDDIDEYNRRTLCFKIAPPHRPLPRTRRSWNCRWVARSDFFFFFLFLLYAGDGLQPRFVVGGPHVHSRQIRGRALDAVRHGAHKSPAAVVLFDHQGSTAVALRERNKKHIRLRIDIRGINRISNSFDETVTVIGSVHKWNYWFATDKYLARIPLSVGVTGAQETVQYGFRVTGRLEHVLTHLVFDYRNLYFLQNAGHSSACWRNEKK